jgi:DNA modification methylase
VVPCQVLDIFAGAGTTLLVADRLGRDAIGIDLQPNYVQMGADRVTNDAPLFASVAIAPNGGEE